MVIAFKEELSQKCSNSNKPKWLHFEVSQYSFSHPEENPRADLYNGSQICRWQHVQQMNGMYIVLQISLMNKVVRIQLFQNTDILEDLDVSISGLSIVSAANCIAFKWPILRGTTRFQVVIRDIKAALDIVTRLEEQDIVIKRKSMEDCQTESGHNIMSQETLVESQESNNKLVKNDAELVAEFRRKQLRQVQRYQRSQKIGIGISADSTIGSASVCTLGNTTMGTSSILSYLNGSKTSLVCRKLKARKPFSFSVLVYSYANINRRTRATQREVTWNHVNLVSGIYLTIIPSDHNGNPIILLNQGENTLETFIPCPTMLQVYVEGNVVALKSKLCGGNSDNSMRCVQLNLVEKDMSVFNECMSFYNIFIMNPNDSYGETTKSTSGFGTRYFSDTASMAMSTTSRDTRYWERRRATLGL